MASSPALLRAGPPLATATSPPAAANDGVLPTDVLHDILLRLPADALCRLRLVCRSWRSLTSEPHFAKAHAARHPLVSGIPFPSRGISFIFMDLHGNVVKRVRRDNNIIRRRTAPYIGWVLSSHLDMVCVSAPWPREGKAVCAHVFNMATGASADLLPHDIPKQEGSVDPVVACMFTLGRVPSTGELKVLRIHHRIRRVGGDRGDGSSQYMTCDIMTLGNNGGRWRVKPRPPFNVWSSSRSGVTAVVNGIAYFLISWFSGFVGNSTSIKPDGIASFDLAAEEWRPAAIQGPISLYLVAGTTSKKAVYRQYTDNIRLAGLDGCLVTVLYRCRDCSMDLWFLEDVESCIWTKRYSMQYTSHPGTVHTYYVYPLVVLDDERVVVWEDSMLKAYDRRTRTWETLATIRDCPSVRKVEGSLVIT